MLVDGPLQGMEQILNIRYGSGDVGLCTTSAVGVFSRFFSFDTHVHDGLTFISSGVRLIDKKASSRSNCGFVTPRVYPFPYIHKKFHGF